MVFMDKRLYERFRVEMPVRFKDYSGQDWQEAVSYDISARGIRLALIKQEIKPQDSLILSLELPGEEGNILCNCRVVWVKPQAQDEREAGLEFNEIRLLNLWRIFDKERRLIGE